MLSYIDLFALMYLIYHTLIIMCKNIPTISLRYLKYIEVLSITTLYMEVPVCILIKLITSLD